LASEYLHKLHQITVSKETLRQWIMEGRPCSGGGGAPVAAAAEPLWELVQWDTSTHDWLEGRGEQICLISMIDDAPRRPFARFVRHDTSEENMRLLWAYTAAHK
jgi:hypothetical protein